MSKLREAAEALLADHPPGTWINFHQHNIAALRAALEEEKAREEEPDTFSLGVNAMEELAAPWTSGPSISGPPEAFGLPPTPPGTLPGGTYEVTEIDHEAKSYTVEPARGTPEPLTLNRCRELAAQAWCQPTTSGIEMDVRIAEEFAQTLFREARPAQPADADPSYISEQEARRLAAISTTAQGWCTKAMVDAPDFDQSCKTAALFDVLQLREEVERLRVAVKPAADGEEVRLLLELEKVVRCAAGLSAEDAVLCALTTHRAAKAKGE